MVDSKFSFSEVLLEISNLGVVVMIVDTKSDDLLLKLRDFLFHNVVFGLVLVALSLVFGAFVFEVVDFTTLVFKGFLGVFEIFVEVVDFFLEFVNIVEHTLLVVLVLFGALVLVFVLFSVLFALDLEMFDFGIIIMVVLSSLAIPFFEISVLAVPSINFDSDLSVLCFEVV